MHTAFRQLWLLQCALSKN